MELRKDEQITLNIDGFIISQNIHNTNTAQSLFGIKNKNNLNIGHDDRTWVLEQDIICDTCNRCVSCQTCNSCNGCVSTVGCNSSCQGCTGSCTGCASGCYESCFGDCYSCQDCQAGCTACNNCTANCNGGCQTECYSCVSCDDCVGCNNECVGCFDSCQEICQKCTACASCNAASCVGFVSCTTMCETSCQNCTTECQTACTGGCTGSCNSGCQNICQGPCVECQTGCQTGCNSACQTSCVSCVDCQACDGSCTMCDGCTIGCQGGCQTGCQTGCTGCTSCTGSCNNCNGTCTSGVCGGTTNGCLGAYTQCTTGCFGGVYCSTVTSGTDPDPGPGGEDNPGEDPGHETKTWKTYCIGTNTGGYKAGINNSCTGGGDDGAHSDCPPEWLEEGHTEEEWNDLDYDSQKDFATEHGYEEENHDPPADFVSTSLEDILNSDADLAKKVKEGTKLAVKTDCDPVTGKITQTIVDKETGEVLRTVEVKEDGSFEYSKPDGSTTAEDVKVDENGDIDSGTSNGEDGKKTDLSDGSTTMPDPNTGQEVNVDPQSGGC